MVKRKKSKMSLPSSGAGLVRYMDEEGKGLKLKPEHVLYFTAGLLVARILLTM